MRKLEWGAKRRDENGESWHRGARYSQCAENKLSLDPVVDTRSPSLAGMCAAILVFALEINRSLTGGKRVSLARVRSLGPCNSREQGTYQVTLCRDRDQDDFVPDSNLLSL